MNRKILILVLSYDEPPYRELMRAQQETFDSVEMLGVKTAYYHGGGIGVFKFLRDDSVQIQFEISDEYYRMGGKFKRMLEVSEGWDYDLIFRTNSSSYVNKEELIKFAEKLPLERCYAGWEIEGNAGYNVVSGAGIWMSRDVADILRENIDPEFEREEDVYCAQILSEHGIRIIDDKSRYDVPSQFSEIPLDRYHYRLKTGDRLQDANNMRKIHQLISQK